MSYLFLFFPNGVLVPIFVLKNFRLLKHDPVENITEVLCKDLYFPNGVQLSKDESHLLVGETTRSRILK